jgi:hypothetical protein
MRGREGAVESTTAPGRVTLRYVVARKTENAPGFWVSGPAAPRFALVLAGIGPFCGRFRVRTP